MFLEKFKFIYYHSLYLIKLFGQILHGLYVVFITRDLFALILNH